MPIQVICPGCHTRFNVGDQHAGKSGACPKCKGPIQIPNPADEVVIHAPELEPGTVDSKGRSILKPIRRKETKFNASILAIVIGLIILSVAVAWLVGKSDLGDAQVWVLAGGAILLGPLVSYAGYSFLRDDELGVYQGSDVLIRSVCCGLVYALLWGVYLFISNQLFGNEAIEAGLNAVQIGGLGAFLLGVGAFAAFVSFDLDPTSGFFHYALYVIVTVGLRFVMGLSFLPGLVLS
ncbi:MAG: hypothetical protein GXP26_14145 [Planctomycetes bacterium]|nr:hypothetical protein [Planctomycetota bacterium]